MSAHPGVFNTCVLTNSGFTHRYSCASFISQKTASVKRLNCGHCYVYSMAGLIIHIVARFLLDSFILNYLGMTALLKGYFPVECKTFVFLIMLKFSAPYCSERYVEWLPFDRTRVEIHVRTTLQRGVIENGTFVSPADFNLSIKRDHPHFHHGVREKKFLYE